MAYPTTAVLVAASSISELTGLTTAQQDSLRDGAISAVEEFCNQSFDEVDEERTMDGNGSRYIILPRRLSKFWGLSVTGSSLTPSDLELDVDKARLSVKPNAFPGDYYTRAIRDDAPPLFTLGIMTVKITGTWGWEDADFPAGVTTAIRMDMEDQALSDASGLQGTARAFRTMGLRNVSQGNVVAAVGGAPGLSERVLRRLEPYVWVDPGALV